MADDEEKLISEPEKNEKGEDEKNEVVADAIEEGKTETNKAESNIANHKEAGSDKPPEGLKEVRSVVQPLLTGNID